MAYATEQSVLREAGMWFRESKGSETPAGDVDGANTVFTVAHFPIADRNGDDIVDENDVVFYDDDTPVTVSSVDENTGAITLAAAPATSSVVEVDYHWTYVYSDNVAEAIEEAEDIINDKLGQLVTTPYTTVPKTVRFMTRVLAAGILMTQEHGYDVTEETTKEGKRKMELILGEDGNSGMLGAYFDRIKDKQVDAAGRNAVSTNKDQRVFEVYSKSEQEWLPEEDEHFYLNDTD